MRPIARMLLGCAGLLTGALILLVSVGVIQGLSGQETFLWLLAYFSLSFAFAFALGGASITLMSGRYSPWVGARALAIGGAAGGAVLATGMQLGPLGLLVAMLAAVAVPIWIGTTLLKGAPERKERRAAPTTVDPSSPRGANGMTFNASLGLWVNSLRSGRRDRLRSGRNEAR